MTRNAYVVGERTLQGNYRKIFVAGEAHISESTIKAIYSAGEVNISNSNIYNLKSAGEINASKCTFGSVKSAGELILKDICKADTVVAVGDLTADYLECRVIRNFTKSTKVSDGMPSIMEWKGIIKADTFESLFDFKLSLDYTFKNIISTEKLYCDEELVCTNLYSFGSLNVPEINCENIFILTNDDNHVDMLAGSKIKIKCFCKPDVSFNNIPKTETYTTIASTKSIVSFVSIEGDDIDIEYTKAKHVGGVNVKIGDLCVIDRVEYSGTISISDKAVVNEVIKL